MTVLSKNDCSWRRECKSGKGEGEKVRRSREVKVMPQIDWELKGGKHSVMELSVFPLICPSRCGRDVIGRAGISLVFQPAG